MQFGTLTVAILAP